VNKTQSEDPELVVETRGIRHKREATADADRVLKKAETRLNDSFQASERALRRLQSSVDRKEGAWSLSRTCGSGAPAPATSQMVEIRIVGTNQLKTRHASHVMVTVGIFGGSGRFRHMQAASLAIE
jgi:hypothetical protein